MKERFLEIKKTVGHKVNEFLKLALEIPPSYEEAYLNFKHGKNCSRSQDLATFSVSVPLAPFDPSAMGNCRRNLMVHINYLECPECHSSVRFSGSNLPKKQ